MKSDNLNYGFYRSFFIREIDNEIEKLQLKATNKLFKKNTKQYLNQLIKLKSELQKNKIKDSNLSANKLVYNKLKRNFYLRKAIWSLLCVFFIAIIVGISIALIVFFYKR
ncbi:hypothetical protein [Mycoplasma nasistruthionis]|uniref:Uncharacterized protein n=1 Tax=Mycoplasma nasistruthionis TaxID=353852 RepID=A0A4Y6I7H1_9MOLU|nr:hypothetical protein [Mycoplasma nasistruthionis]QCZ36560.1 hypothetical protein FG904_00815 [Mycoplasma nasistruthionis]QDF64858.1 hypothetical protein FIV53_00830 [Mycoplasma nasistruthionis]